MPPTRYEGQVMRFCLAAIVAALLLSGPAVAGSARTCIPFDQGRANLQSHAAEVFEIELTDGQMAELRRRVSIYGPITRALWFYSPQVNNRDREPVLFMLIEVGGCAQGVGEFTPSGLERLIGPPVELPSMT